MSHAAEQIWNRWGSNMLHVLMPLCELNLSHTRAVIG